jgi:cell division protein FtsB
VSWCIFVVYVAGSANKRQSIGPRAAGRTRQIAKMILILFAIVIGVDALVGEQGFVAIRQARRQHDHLVAAIAHKQAENAALAEQVQRLQHDPGTIEELARKDLGFISPGEKVFIVKDLPPHAQP